MTGRVRLRLHSFLGLERGSDVSGGPPEPKIPPGSPGAAKPPQDTPGRPRSFDFSLAFATNGLLK
eukprot:5371113-Pyramimonas_sp.AAC.1